MYSAAESSKIRQDFWTTFGQYMKPVPSAQGYRINWQNYKTGVKDVYFRMKTERDFISIGIEICHKDDELQQLYFANCWKLNLKNLGIGNCTNLMIWEK